MVHVIQGQELKGVDVVLVREDDETQLIQGVVLDPEGEPVPWALISSLCSTWLGGTWKGHSMAGEDGRFSFKPAKSGAHTIFAKPQTFTSVNSKESAKKDPKKDWSPAIAYGVRKGSDIVLRLSKSHPLHLWVHDENGEPISELSVSTRSTLESSWEIHPPKDVRTHNGLVELSMPPLTFTLGVSAFGYAGMALQDLDPKAIKGAPPTIRVTLKECPVLRGVVTADGREVSDAGVSLHRLARGPAIKSGFPQWLSTSSLGSVQTGDDGVFQLNFKEPKQFYIRVSAKGYAIAELGPFPAERARDKQPFNVELTHGGSISGRILGAGGGSGPAGLIVGISRGDGAAQTQRVGPGGKFHFKNLTPGRWMVEQRDEELSRWGASSSTGMGAPYKTTPWVCEVLEGQETKYDLVLGQIAEQVVLQGYVQLGSSPMQGWSVELTPLQSESGSNLVRGVVGAKGRFMLAVAKPGAYSLKLAADGTSRDHWVSVRILAQLDLHKGENTWDLELPTAHIRGENGPRLKTGDAPAIFVWQGKKGLLYAAVMAAEANGEFRLQDVPAGPSKILRPSKSTKGTDLFDVEKMKTWQVLKELNLQPGTEIHISL